MIPRFSHERPRRIEDALAAYEASNDEGTYYAGGTELLQIMKAGFAAYGVLIDLKHIDELRGIETTADGSLRIGATATHREIERSLLVREHVPGLARLIRHVANVRVRNTGTLGGNLAFAEPHSDPAAFLLACGADVELVGPDGRRRVGIDEFIIGPLMTSRDPAEIVVAIHVPAAGAGVGRSYEKIAFFERPAAAVGVRLVVADGAVREAVVTLGSVTDVPIAVDAVAARLTGIPATADDVTTAAKAAAEGLGDVEVVGDHNGSADFKRHLAAGLLVRAAEGAMAEALGEVPA
jgi:carbon-monoxide dehydrogenase medium subunit